MALLRAGRAGAFRSFCGRRVLVGEPRAVACLLRESASGGFCSRALHVFAPGESASCCSPGECAASEKRTGKSERVDTSEAWPDFSKRAADALTSVSAVMIIPTVRYTPRTRVHPSLFANSKLQQQQLTRSLSLSPFVCSSLFGCVRCWFPLSAGSNENNFKAL